ncbi:MAG: InlB B-repeat-containing protein, partial [Oscillospiraceae bacterium]|nr:InlB B-repeat-containing protein [Oscillospiraceae bacterium]
GGGGEVVYQLTDHIEDGLNYIIVAQNTISGTSAKAVGNTVVTSNKYLSAVSVTLNNTDNTVTATAANLPKVVWKAAGNATSGFSFYNAAINKYMALNSAQVLYPATSGIIYWLYESDQELNNQVDSEGYYWLSYSDGSDSVGYERYTTSKSENSNPMNLYVETQLGTTYYTTDPVASTPTYTVTFKDWDGTVLKTEEVEQGGSATAPANPTRVGYTFTGWDVAFNNVQSDLVVTAQYTINTYTVTFKDWDGTVLKTQTVNYGGAATAPADPTREGYTFIGWDVAFNNVTSNLVVTAQYKQNEIPSDYLKGDVNCDGLVDSADITLAAAYAMSAGSVTAQGIANGDMNGDGLLTAADLSALYGYIQG